MSYTIYKAGNCPGGGNVRENMSVGEMFRGTVLHSYMHVLRAIDLLHGNCLTLFKAEVM